MSSNRKHNRVQVGGSVPRERETFPPAEQRHWCLPVPRPGLRASARGQRLRPCWGVRGGATFLCSTRVWLDNAQRLSATMKRHVVGAPGACCMSEGLLIRVLAHGARRREQGHSARSRDQRTGQQTRFISSCSRGAQRCWQGQRLLDGRGGAGLLGQLIAPPRVLGRCRGRIERVQWRGWRHPVL